MIDDKDKKKLSFDELDMVAGGQETGWERIGLPQGDACRSLEDIVKDAPGGNGHHMNKIVIF